MATAVYSITDYPTYASLKRAHPEVFSAFRVSQTWFATVNNPFVIGFRPNQHRKGIRTKKNRSLGTLRPRGRRRIKHNKD